MRAPTSPFSKVAQLIANGAPPPDWLIPDLEHYSRLIRYRNPERGDEDEDRALLTAVRSLERLLVQEAHVYDLIEKQFGEEFPAPVIIEDTANKLFELAEFLESQLPARRKGGPTPDTRRGVCAQRCATAWRRLHGEMQPYSPKLWEACEAYWQACGHPATSTEGALKNWKSRSKA